MKKTNDFLKEHIPFVKVRKNHAIITWEDKKFEVPSHTYPVLNKPTLKYFSYVDTVQLPRDGELATLFNEIEFKVGFCYQNIEKFSALLKSKNLNSYKIYTGWIVMNGLPVHHCWMVWKDKHIIDPGVTLIDNIYLNEARRLQHENGGVPLEMDEMRKLFVSIHNEYIEKPNADFRTFGQAAPFALYVGTETTPMQGRRLFNDLMDKMPNHPSYASGGMNGQGESTLQKMLRNQS